jgi:DNA-binding winged helix-turn-helix (wHTH) protein
VRIRFGDCILDIDARRLACGNRAVHLPPKAFEVLKLLVASSPRALSKRELLEGVWPGVFVSDASLAKVISKVRAAIGDHDESAPMVRTVHAYGYSFAAAAVELPRDAAPLTIGDRAVCWLFCGNREFVLHDGEHLVGRDTDAAVCLDSPKVSRRHAKLVVSGMTATLEDLGSKNGSFVRGIRIDGPTRLESGDEARIGPFTLIFRVESRSRSTQTATR